MPVHKSRGYYMRSPRSVHELTKMVRSYRPQILFLSETKRKSSKMVWLQHVWNFSGCFVVESRGRSGGLCLLWTDCIQVTISTYFVSHIDAIITGSLCPEPFRFTGFYGHPITNQRVESWNLLTQLRNQNGLPWCCVGDFNEILRCNEKQGGRPRPY